MSTTITQQMDICELLQTLSLVGTTVNKDQELANASRPATDVQEPDATMSDDPSYQSDAASDSSSSSTRRDRHGCAYLQAIQSQMDTYQTTDGQWLDAIFTHREIFSSYPGAHHECARGFSDIAYEMEMRAWRADREADTEAVAAFRHEAWCIANTMTYQTPYMTKPSNDASGSPPVCMMQPMM